MTTLDTDVLVRYLARDDDAQFKIAPESIDGCTSVEPGYMPRSHRGTVWVLERSYKYPREEIA